MRCRNARASVHGDDAVSVGDGAKEARCPSRVVRMRGSILQMPPAHANTTTSETSAGQGQVPKHEVDTLVAPVTSLPWRAAAAAVVASSVHGATRKSWQLHA